MNQFRNPTTPPKPEEPQSSNGRQKAPSNLSAQQISGRAWFIFTLLSILALAIVIKVFVIQLFPDERALNLAENFTYRINEIEPMRGQILSSDGALLATSVPEYDIHWDSKASYDKEEFEKSIDAICNGFATIQPDKSAAHFKQLLRKAQQKGDRYAEIINHVNYNQLQDIKKLPLIDKGQYKSGFVFTEKYIRNQPFGMLASRTIGIDREEDKVGLEEAYDTLLAGKKGKQRQEKIAGGIWKPVDGEFVVEPQAGCDIVSTIDIHLQDVAHNALRNQLDTSTADWGCAIVMEVNTGFIKAIANLSRNKKGEYIENLNTAVRTPVEPGSTMKLASMLACLDVGNINLTDTVQTGNGIAVFAGHPMKDSNWDKGGSGTLTVEQVFEKSSNIGTAKLVKKVFGERQQEYLDKLHSFGFGQRLGIELDGEGESKLYKKTMEPGWSKISLTQLAIGYETEMTALQMLAFYNAIANNGVFVKPQFVEEIRRNGRVIKETQPVVLHENFCKPETILKVKKMMEGVMEPGGTAANAFKGAPYRVGGKTGTAWMHENGKYVEHGYRASFVGYFPAEAPKYSCIVVVHHPTTGHYYGGLVAAPVFKELADRVYSTQMEFHELSPKEDSLLFAKRHIPISKSGNALDLETVFAGLNIQRKTSLPGSWMKASTSQTNVELSAIDPLQGQVPNVIGMGLQDALFLLERSGLRVQVIGYGTVRKQSLPAGNSIVGNSPIVIELAS